MTCTKIHDSVIVPTTSMKAQPRMAGATDPSSATMATRLITAVPIAFLFTGIHGDYHQLTDEPQYIDYPHYARITSFARDLLVRVADLDHRVVVDKPKPDPNGSCQQ